MGIDNLGSKNVESSLCLEGWNPGNSTGEALKNFQQKLGWQTQGKSHHSKESNACKKQTGSWKDGIGILSPVPPGLLSAFKKNPDNVILTSSSIITVLLK